MLSVPVTAPSDYFNGGQPTWNKITTLPAGTPAWFGITRDGSRAYFAASNVLYTTATPKTPSWSQIVAVGDSAAGDTIQVVYGDLFVIQNTTLYTAVALNTATHWAYGEYNGSAWAWSRTTNISTFSPDGVAPQTYSLGRVVRNNSNTQLEDLSASTAIGYQMYRATGGSRYVSNLAGGTLYLHSVGGSNLATLGTSGASSSVQDTKVTGAETGAQVYCVPAGTTAGAGDGHLWLSNDGSAFADTATWAPGWVRDAALAGGGSLVWVLKSISGSAVPTRLYNRDGSVLRDMTGNLWSLTSGGQTVVGMGLVY